jgi:prepilin-type N-terminal cleavage/methylation domain-containing protein
MSSGERGFTLLEFLCAFAIVATVTGFLAVVTANSHESAMLAISQRELREAADTLFRRIIYEIHQHHDGDSRTLDDAYADFAGLQRWERDRWQIYRYELRKVLKAAAGVSEDAEPIFEGDVYEEEERVRSGQGTRRPGDEADEEGEAAGEELWQLTMRIYETEGGSAESALLVLRTYVPVREGDADR